MHTANNATSAITTATTTQAKEIKVKFLRNI